MVDGLARLVKPEFIQRLAHFARGRRQPRKNPAMHQFAFALHRVRRLRANFGSRHQIQSDSRALNFLQIHEQKPRRIPNFVRERARAQDPVLGQRNVRPRRRHARQHVAQRVRSVLLRQFQRIHPSPLGLGHLRAFRRAHQRMQIQPPEGNSIFFARARSQMQPHHDHPRVPKK